jgi:hypothetical protein
MTLSRREAIQRLTLLMGGALSPELTSSLQGQVSNTGGSITVTPEQEALLAEVADVIIPTTDTPGAKAAGVEQFIIRVMRDCFVKKQQESFYASLAKLDADCHTSNGKGFMKLDTEAKHAAVKQCSMNDKTFFKLLRELTVAGYFTSEIGATKALEYLPIPGAFSGDVIMAPGQKAWSII